MPFNKINTTLTPAQMSDIAAAIDTIINTLPVKFNLTKAERTSLSNINNERYPYVQRAIQNHGPANPTLVSGYAGTLAEAANDLVFYDQMKAHILRLRQALEIYEDTQQVAGSEAYTWTRMLYNSAKDAASNQVPGADAVADDLATLFGAQGGGTPPPPPPPVTASITMLSDQTIPGMITVDITGNSFATGIEQVTVTWETGLFNTSNTADGIHSIYNWTYTIGGTKTLTVTGDIITIGAMDISNNKITSFTPAGSNKILSFNASNNALDADSIHRIIIWLDGNGISNGTLNLSGGTNAAPVVGFPALASLIAKGWTVTTN